MDLRQLEVFVQAVRTRNFSKAAESLQLTQPTVSEHTRLLEEELGARLFDRFGRETVPTRAADLLLTYAKRLLALRSEAHQALEQFMGHLTGELAIGASTIPSEYVLPAVIGRFGDRYPKVSVALRAAALAEERP